MRASLTAMLVLIAASAVDAQDVAVHLGPPKQSYALADPMSIRLRIRNTSSRVVTLLVRYPDTLGCVFSCSDEDSFPTTVSNVKPQPKRLLPEEEHGTRFALKRYLRFKRPKRYDIKYRLYYYTGLVEGEEGQFRSSSVAGEFAIELRPGPLTEEEVRRFDEDLRGAVKNRDVKRTRETAELLCWVDDPRVIPSLEFAAAWCYPAGRDILRAVSNFASTQRGQRALLNIAQAVDGRVLPAALDACREHGVSVPSEVYRKLLSSNEHTRSCATLEYLLEHGNAAHVRLVEPLQDHPHHGSIRALATKVAAKLKGKKIPDNGALSADAQEAALLEELDELDRVVCATDDQMAGTVQAYKALVQRFRAPYQQALIYRELARKYYHERTQNPAHAEKAAPFYVKALEYPWRPGEQCRLYYEWADCLIYSYRHRQPAAYAEARRRAVVPCLKGMKVAIHGLEAKLPQTSRETLLEWHEGLMDLAASYYSLPPDARPELRELARATLEDEQVVDQLMERQQSQWRAVRNEADQDFRQGRVSQAKPPVVGQVRPVKPPVESREELTALKGPEQAPRQGSAGEWRSLPVWLMVGATIAGTLLGFGMALLIWRPWHRAGSAART